LLESRFPGEVFSAAPARSQHGGRIVIDWEDGLPAVQVIDALWPLEQHYQGSIAFRAERRYSRSFLERVAAAYCRCCSLPVPRVLEHGRPRLVPTRLGTRRVDREISGWCERVAEGALSSLAFRRDEQGHVWQSRLVLKKDYSAGMYAHLAVIGRPGYVRISGPHVWFDIYDVERAGPHRVTVVEGSGSRYLFTSVKDASGRAAATGNDGRDEAAQHRRGVALLATCSTKKGRCTVFEREMETLLLQEWGALVSAGP